METRSTEEFTSGNEAQEESVPPAEETSSKSDDVTTEDGTDPNASNMASIETENDTNSKDSETSQESKIQPPSPSSNTENPSDQVKITLPSTTSKTTTNSKVKIHFIAVGSAPLMKKSKFQIPVKEPFGSLQVKMRKMLQLPDSSRLFLYLHQSFVPSPEDLIGDLGGLFCVRGELKIHYSLQEAWG